MAALGLRLAAIFIKDPEQTTYLHLRSFQVLSMCAPLIWISKSNDVGLGVLSTRPLIQLDVLRVGYCLRLYQVG